MKPNIKHHLIKGLLLGGMVIVPLTAAVRAADAQLAKNPHELLSAT